jgi:Co/Zn/Cd efflux system component
VTAARGTEEIEPELDAHDAAERRTLVRVLAINATQALVAGGVGIAAQSTGLLGAALDNLGDAAVYAVSLYAVGRTVVAKARVARLSGVLLILSAVALLAEVIRRFVTGSDPVGLAMILAALANAATNVWALRLLRSHRHAGVHLEASWIFTTNDMLANLGVAVSGVAVMLLRSNLPDLVIGLLVFGIVAKGAWEILENAGRARQGAKQASEKSPGGVVRRDDPSN